MDHVGHCALLGPVVWVLDPIAKLLGPRKGKNKQNIWVCVPEEHLRT